MVDRLCLSEVVFETAQRSGVRIEKNAKSIDQAAAEYCEKRGAWSFTTALNLKAVALLALRSHIAF